MKSEKTTTTKKTQLFPVGKKKRKREKQMEGEKEVFFGNQKN